MLAQPRIVSIMIDLLQSANTQIDSPPITWKSVNQYAEKLMDWNERFGPGFEDQEIADLAQSLPEHSGIFEPTGVSITLGCGLVRDLDVTMQILEYELANIGVRFENRLKDSRVEYLTGSEPRADCKSLRVALLDIDSFWEPSAGVSVREVRSKLERPPTHEATLLLALHPYIFQEMGDGTFPNSVAAGLMIDGDQVPCFHRDKGVYFADGGWSGNPWRSVVVLR